MDGKPEIKVGPPPPADAGIVIHDGGTGICPYDKGRTGPPSWAHPHCGSCTCHAASQRAGNGFGTFVRCWCGRNGVVPDAGHIQDFLPPGTTVHYEAEKIVITLGVPHG